MLNKNDEYYNDLNDILPRVGVPSKYFIGISPEFTRRFIGSYHFTNELEPILSEDFYDSERFAAQDNQFNHAAFEFFQAKNFFDNGIRFIDDNSNLKFGRITIKENDLYKNISFIDGRIFNEFGLFQIYNETIYFYKKEDLIRYSEEKNESLEDIKRHGLPLINNVMCVKVTGDFEWLFNITCLIREGNSEILSIFNNLDGNIKSEEIHAERR